MILPMTVTDDNGNAQVDLLKIIADGSYGKVYEGLLRKDITKKTPVAVKRQYASYEARQEYTMLKLFKSEYIIKQFCSIDTDKYYHYIVMEIGHMDLTRYAKSFKESVSNSYVFTYIARQIISGLHEIHKRGIIHRDLKPGNIIVVDKTFKIADFGAAVEASKHPWTYKGTEKYVAPEVALEKVYDIKADIWSLGIIFFYICTLTYPFDTRKCRIFLADIARKLDLGEAKTTVLSYLSKRNITIEKLTTDPLIFVDHTLYFGIQRITLKCLKCHPNARLTAAQLLDDPLFSVRRLTNLQDVPSAIGSSLSNDESS